MIETKFKNTELGPIPEDWDIMTLGDIGEVKMCKRVMKSQTSEKGDVPFYKISTFGNKADAFISHELYAHLKHNFSFPKQGAILLSAAGTIGRTVIYNGEDAFFQDSNIVWLDNDESILNNTYLFLYYSIAQWVTENGGIVNRLYNESIRNTRIFFPKNKDEQIKIYDAIHEVDALISSLDKQIAKKRLIKQGAMQQLLTGKTRLEGFVGKWKNIALSELYKCQKGKGLNKEKLSDDGLYPCILYGELFTKYAEVITNVVSHTSYNEGEPSIDNDLLLPGSTTTNGLDLAKASAIMQDNVLLGGDVIIYRPKVEVDSRFIAYAIPLYKEKILPYTQGITIIHLKGNSMLEMTINIPPTKEEQTAIANILSDMDAEISALEAKRDKYQKIKQGMMDKLLTGKIRLV